MNIVIVHCGKGIYGGAELVIKELTQYLCNQRRHKVITVIKNVPESFYSSLHPDISCYQPETHFELRKIVQNLIGWADVINVHNFPATLATFPIRLRCKSAVWMCNEPAEMFTNWKRKPIEAFNRWWVRASGMSAVVADKYNADRFERIYKVKPRIIPYGIDYNFWSGGKHYKKNEDFIVLQVGHSELFGEGKDIVAELRNYIPKVELVQLAGKSHIEVRNWYNRANVLIHPIKSQGGWLVPFEAMCASLPVVVSDKFTGADLIENNNLGIVTDDIAEGVRSVIRNKIVSSTDEQKEWIRDNMTWEKFGKEMLDAYKANFRK